MASTTGVGADYTSVYNAVTSVKSEIARETGKDDIVVLWSPGATGCNGLGADPQTFSGATAQMFDGCAGSGSNTEALAAAQGYVNARENANTYVVVVSQG